jgi:putative ABC transport system permease protein
MRTTFYHAGLRSFWNKRAFSFLNIGGLAVGLAASILLFLVIKNETSYDTYHSKKDRIYRVVTTKHKKSNNEISLNTPGAPPPLPGALKQNFPQVEATAAILEMGNAQFYIPQKNGSEEKRFIENSGLFWTEPGMYEIFDYKWIAGNGNSLKKPNTAVIAESVAKKFFGSVENALGKTIQLYSFRIPLEVIGIFKDLPANTDVPIRVGASFITLKDRVPEVFATDGSAWQYRFGQCFLLLKEGQSPIQLQTQLPGFVKRYFSDENGNSADYSVLALQPLSKMHFDTDFEIFRTDGLSLKELWSLGLIGLFLLIVACINFINLATAQSVNRAKEIGVRKVLGGNRSQLVKQFMLETSFITFFSLCTGFLLAQLCLPLLNDLLGKDLSMNIIRQPSALLFMLLVGVFVTFLAGFYPAMVLSGFNPIMIFRNKLISRTSGGLSLRRVLVVFQFVIAQLLVIGTIVVVKQMSYFRNRPMGFDKEGIALINLPSDSALKVKYPLLQKSMVDIPGVTSASLCMEAPANFFNRNHSFYFDNRSEKEQFNIAWQFADTGYLKTFGIQLLAGRSYFPSDTVRELLINETGVKKLGFRSPNDILGKTIAFDDKQEYPIVGVIKDFNSRSLHTGITPMVLTSSYESYEWIAIRMDRASLNSTLSQVQKTFTNIYPTYIYDQVFFDERIEHFYQNEAVTSRLFKIFSILAIFISCLGLYGLVSFMAVQKTKEVGVRKVLGASVQSIVYLFSKEFTLLIGIAFLIAAPLGYYLMNKWLTGFFYHTNFGWEVLVGAMVISVIVAWITVGYKAVKAAIANPIKSLRTE